MENFVNKVKLRIFRALVFAILSMGCSPTTTYDLVVTTTFLGDLSSQIAGNDLSVYTLMKPGVDPHLYRATAGDVDRLINARLILYNGLHLEAKLTEVLKKLGDKAFAVAQAIPRDRLIMLDEFGTADPHIWWDPQVWLIVAEAVYEKCASLLPPSQHSNLQERYHQVKQEILRAHQEALELFESLPPERRVLVSAHDAFQYFGRAYDFTLKSIQGISTITEANTRVIDELADWMVSHRVPTAFFESTISPRTIKALEEAIRNRGGEFTLGGELFSDSTGSEKGTETWRGSFLHNVHIIHQALLRGNNAR